MEGKEGIIILLFEKLDRVWMGFDFGLSGDSGYFKGMGGRVLCSGLVLWAFVVKKKNGPGEFY